MMTFPLRLVLVACVLTSSTRVFDRRVVDVAEVGNARSEANHGYAGDDVVTGVVDGTPFRQARGWMRYALAIFDDTEVTVALTFVPQAVDDVHVPRRYDVLVEDSLVASRTFTAQTTTPTVVDIVVPLAITKGRTSIAVTIRARGGPTPALRELRTIQDHNEVDPSPTLFRVTR